MMSGEMSFAKRSYEQSLQYRMQIRDHRRLSCVWSFGCTVQHPKTTKRRPRFVNTSGEDQRALLASDKDPMSCMRPLSGSAPGKHLLIRDVSSAFRMYMVIFKFLLHF